MFNNIYVIDNHAYKFIDTKYILKMMRSIRFQSQKQINYDYSYDIPWDDRRRLQAVQSNRRGIRSNEEKNLEASGLVAKKNVQSYSRRLRIKLVGPMKNSIFEAAGYTSVCVCVCVGSEASIFESAIGCIYISSWFELFVFRIYRLAREREREREKRLSEQVVVFGKVAFWEPDITRLQSYTHHWTCRKFFEKRLLRGARCTRTLPNQVLRLWLAQQACCYLKSYWWSDIFFFFSLWHPRRTEYSMKIFNHSYNSIILKFIDDFQLTTSIYNQAARPEK